MQRDSRAYLADILESCDATSTALSGMQIGDYVMVVLLGGRWLPLEIAALALALWLPSADRFERGPRG
jgi:hypothetical protein